MWYSFPWHQITTWYQEHGAHTFPWREYSLDHQPTLVYRIWLAEILLQQTQADRVIPYFTRIIASFPTIQALAYTDYETFFPYYQGMGYYSRAKNLLKTASIVHTEYGDIFPQDPKILQTLPGIWAYTSAAICAFWYGAPLLAWDTNLEKVFSRYLFGNSKNKLSPTEKQHIEADYQHYIASLFSGDQLQAIRDINNGLMDFARMIDNKNPDTIDWDSYPIRSWIFFQTRWSEEKKESKKNNTFPTPDARTIVILHSDHKIYFSFDTHRYTPFILPPAGTRNIRSYVQDFFRAHYGLEVSVRPIRKKWLTDTWEPYIAVNVQIQTGLPAFTQFPSKDAQPVIRHILSMNTPWQKESDMLG